MVTQTLEPTMSLTHSDKFSLYFLTESLYCVLLYRPLNVDNPIFYINTCISSE